MRESQEEIDRVAINVMINRGSIYCDDMICHCSRGLFSKDQQDNNDSIDKWERIRSAIGNMRAGLLARIETRRNEPHEE